MKEKYVTRSQKGTTKFTLCEIVSGGVNTARCRIRCVVTVCTRRNQILFRAGERNVALLRFKTPIARWHMAALFIAHSGGPSVGPLSMYSIRGTTAADPWPSCVLSAPQKPATSRTGMREMKSHRLHLKPTSIRRRMKNELNFPPNFERLVLGCIDADLSK